MVFGVAAIGVVKCYYDAYKCVRLPAVLPLEHIGIDATPAFFGRFVREYVRKRLGRISNEVLGLPESAES